MKLVRCHYQFVQHVPEMNCFTWHPHPLCWLGTFTSRLHVNCVWLSKVFTWSCQMGSCWPKSAMQTQWLQLQTLQIEVYVRGERLCTYLWQWRTWRNTVRKTFWLVFLHMSYVPSFSGWWHNVTVIWFQTTNQFSYLQALRVSMCFHGVDGPGLPFLCLISRYRSAPCKNTCFVSIGQHSPVVTPSGHRQKSNTLRPCGLVDFPPVDF